MPSSALVIDQRTSNRNYPLPFPTNKTRDDILRLVSSLQAIDLDIFQLYQVLGQVSGKAPLDSPEFTGAPTAPTPGQATNSTRIATTAFVQSLVSQAKTDLLNGAPDAYNTLKEIADYIAADGATANALTSAIATKLSLAGGTLTGALAGTSLTLSSTLGVSGAASVAGLLSIGPVSEKVVDVAHADTINYDASISGIFYHSANPTANWVANFTNLPTADGHVHTLNVFVPQSATARNISSVTIDGAAATVQWPSGTVPTGTASKVDIWSFAFVRRAAAWTVFGQVGSTFG